MRLGISSYSFARSLRAGTMTIHDVIDWVADAGADHLELAVGMFGDDLPNDPALVDAIGQRAADRDVELANYVTGADFRGDDVREQVDRVKAHLDVAARLGIRRFRHDVVAWAWRDADQDEFERTFEHVVPICQELADHAAPAGITTTVENHGFFMNDSERIRRLVRAVDRPNFRTLLDVGNFLCVDEDPVLAVQLTLPMAAVVHVKDFHVQQTPPGSDRWLRTLAGRAILGTVIGFGQLPMQRIVDLIAASGFDGPISIEFEGLEDEAFAIAEGIAAVRRFWEQATAA